MKSPLRIAEVLVGLLALAVPITASRTALVLAVAGAGFVALLASWPSTLARSGVGLAVVGNAVTIPQRVLPSAVLMWSDAALLAAFLLLGAAVEVGMRRWDDAPTSWWLRHARRVGVVAVVAAVLVMATWLRPTGSLWLVLAGMVAALVVLYLARNDRTESGQPSG